ncbi:MAG: ATP-binding domain-containing protein, partial [Clostridia bacterium]|nr:ATP-binding domain-containing protein [Clostridia bacterium]
MNGDLGMVEEIRGQDVLVQYSDGLVSYSGDDLKELEPAWAVTIHKGQGSEFKAVIVPVTTSHYVMLHRNLIYTAITRAREKVILVGTKKALAIAVKNNRPIQRYTMLADILES